MSSSIVLPACKIKSHSLKMRPQFSSAHLHKCYLILKFVAYLTVLQKFWFYIKENKKMKDHMV